MKFDKVLCRLGETALKSGHTRRFFEDKLVSNMEKGLKQAKIVFSVEKEPGRIFIKTKKVEKSCEVLEKIFGLTSISPVKENKIKADMNRLVDYAEKFAGNYIGKNDSFAVRARRTGNQNFTSQRIERIVGERILKKIGGMVDLENPDKTLFIEVRQNKAYYFREKIECPGGLPLGTQGNVVALFSGGIDSAVAAWMMMKRGCKVFPLYINTGPYSDEKNDVERAKKVLGELNKWASGNKMKLYSVKNGKVMDEIIEKTENKFRCLLCKRMMYRIAEKLCIEKKASAIATGENIGQVASQTLENMAVINSSTEKPVLRPLLGLNKEEIVELAKKIGTYKSSIMTSGECSAVPEKPRTKGRLSEVLKEEKKLDVDKLIKDSMKTLKNF